MRCKKCGFNPDGNGCVIGKDKVDRGKFCEYFVKLKPKREEGVHENAYPPGVRPVTEAEWEASMDRLDAGAIEPCDHWSIEECFCRGACSCHWVPEDNGEVCNCQENWDFTFCGNGEEPDIQACAVVLPKIRSMDEVGTFRTDVNFDDMTFEETEEEKGG